MCQHLQLQHLGLQNSDLLGLLCRCGCSCLQIPQLHIPLQNSGLQLRDLLLQ